MRHLLIIFVTLMASVFASNGTVQAQQPLPASAWYAVVHQPETDTLRWINADGEQASLPRPALPNEAQYLDMRMSPDGQKLVMAAQLNNGLQALGVYNLAAGVFVQTHSAQPGETIHLGARHSFSADSQLFAAGLSGGDFANPTWRVIVFDAQSGDAVSFIDHTHPQAPDAPLSSPLVQMLDGTFVHFQMIPQGVGGANNWPAYAWRAFGFDPAAALIGESPYTLAEMDVLPTNGQVAASYTDAVYASAAPSGMLPNFNAVGWNIPTSGNATPTTVHADSSRYHLAARWANNGDWLLFLSDDASNDRHWNIVQTDGTPGDNSFIPLSPQIEQVYGTSDGYLLINASNMLIYTNGFNPNTAPDLVQLTAASEVIYVTPIGMSFDLATVGGGPAVNVAPPQVIIPPAAPAQPEQPIVADCSLVPVQRVSIGSGARVIPAQGGLNLRNAPNGSILTELGGGEVFDVIGGAVCEVGLYWWQVNADGQIGWVAEATQAGYLIEPYDVPPPATPAPPPVAPLPEAQPTCGSAPETRLSVGMPVLFITNQGPLSSPDGAAIAERAFMSGTQATVVGGPECVGERLWWQVTGTARNTASNSNATVTGWVVETTPSGQYRLGP